MKFRILTVCTVFAASSLLSATASGAAAAGRYDGEGKTLPGCSRPGQVLDLKNWKITLPVDDPDQPGEQPLDVVQPRLNRYVLPPWFVVARGCHGVQFRNAVNGMHTPNSSYARSELREMTNNGTTEANWSPTAGTHTMVVDQAIEHLPNDKPHVVAGQIHDGSDDVTVFRLEGTNLYLTDGDNTHHKLITDNYVLGTRFQAKFTVRDGRIDAYYNGVWQTTLPATFEGAYFKAGAYTQANCTNSAPCDETNYGQVTIYRLTVRHG